MTPDERREKYCREGEVCTSFEDVAEDMATDHRLQRAGSNEREIKGLILEHFESLTIADILREAIAASDMAEVESLIEIMKEDAES